MLWFLINWLFSWLVGTLLAYAIIKWANNEKMIPFDMGLWSSTWAPGAIGSFIGTALGIAIGSMIG